jgi:predicted dehydrogenase
MNRVKIVVVGLNFGNYVLNQIVNGPGAEFLELVGVCDLDPAKRAEKAASLGVTAYDSLDAVIADPAVEAVGLFTGPAGRAGLIRQIIRAGKHVLTTKPFELDADAALDVLREAERRGMAVFMNSPSPLLPPDLAQVDVWQQRFDLGRPVAARFDVWGSYHEQADGSWYDDPAKCPAAPLFRIGIYLINDAVRLFGEAQEVHVLTSRIRTGRPTPDNAQMGILFRSGAIVNIFASFCVDDGDSHRNQMTLNLERGTIYRNCGPLANAGLEGSSEMALVRRGEGGRKVAEHIILPGFHPQHVYQWDVFQRAVRGIRPVSTVAPETVAAGIRIVEAMARADANGGRATVALVSEKESLTK